MVNKQELIQALKDISEYCEQQDKCSEYIFLYSVGCMFRENWYLFTWDIDKLEHENERENV